MFNSDPIPGTERRNLIFNSFMFGLMGLISLIYVWTFVAHIASGLASSMVDELLLLAILASTGFYSVAAQQAYKAYVRTNGRSFSIGPFTILSTSILPASTTPAIPQTSTMGASIPYSPKREGTPFSLYDPATPRTSTDMYIDVCPPTPDSVSSTPMLITPQLSESYRQERSHEDKTPSRPSRFASRTSSVRSLSKTRQDLEQGDADTEIYGLGMGSIGRRDEEEINGVRP